MSGTWEELFGAASGEEAAGEAAGLTVAQFIPGLDVIVDVIVAAAVISSATGALSGDTVRGAHAKSKATTNKQAVTTPCSDCQPPEEDPCKDVCNQEHGDSHDNMKWPKYDGLHSHHIIGQQAAKDAGVPENAMGELPAIRMLPEDHSKTGSYGRGARVKRFNQQQTELLERGDTQDAFDYGAGDIQEKFPNNENYKIGLKQAQECLDCKRKHGQVK
jgi:hypothetical protein